MRNDLKAFALRGVIYGISGGLIFFISETFLSLIYAEISQRTYLFFLLLYLSAGIVGGLFFGIFLYWIVNKFKIVNSFQDNPNFVPASFLTITFFIYGFFYINEKLTPGLGVFAPVSLAANFIYLVFSLILFRIALGYPSSAKKSAFLFVEIAALPLSLLVAFNFRFFLWHSPITDTGELFIGTIVFGLVSIIGLGLTRGVAYLLKNKSSDYFIRTLNVSFAVIGLIIIAISGRPSAASFQLLKPKAGINSDVNTPKNIIWIVMDTARRDQISIYGGEPKLTPNIDAFSQDALVFNRAVSSAPWTIPSHASMFTGMFPSKHAANRGVPGGKFTNPLSKENLTIAEILQSHGYNTACMAANVAGLSRNFGFSQGFNYYFDSRPIAYHLLWGKTLQKLTRWFRVNILRTNEICLTSEMNGLVFDWLDRRPGNQPFFLFVNLMEPHDGVQYIPEPYYSMFNYDKSEFDKVLKKIDQKKVVSYQQKITQKEIDMLATVVARRVVFMDYHIGKLIEKLKHEGIYDDAFVIITSDHGELNGEHCSFGHNTDLYNELIWIPLMVKYPGNTKRGFSDKTVQNIDIMPELLSKLGIDIPEQIQGQPFVEVSHEIIAELFEQKKAQALLYPKRYYRDLRAIFTNIDGDTLKYIWSSNGQDELFDMSYDMKELANLAEERPGVVKALDEKLQNWLNSLEPIKIGKKGEMKYTKEVEERLRSLGYLK